MQDCIHIRNEKHYGEVIRRWRKEVLKCSASTLLEVYNETFGTDYSQRWWERMEKENKVPTDVNRRLVIAALLQIPFADLGLHLPQTEKKPLLLPLLTGKTVIDVLEYQNHLALLWSSKYERGQEATRRINLLEDALLYGSESHKPQIAELLCEYLLFWSNVERNFSYLSSAFMIANKAIQIAEGFKMPYLGAKAYYMRGYATYDGWRASTQRNYDSLMRVIADMEKASLILKESKQNGGVLEVAILEFWGGSAIHQAQDVSDKQFHLSKLNIATKVLASATRSAPPDPFFFKIDENWLHIGRAEALIAGNWPGSALTELGKVPSGNAKKLRRFLTAAIIEAEAYRAMGKVDMATAYALEALETAKMLKADSHIARIDALYQDMRSEEKYKSSSELMRLGIEVVKARYPAYF